MTYPWHWTPRDIVAHSLQVDHGYGRNGGRGEALAGIRRVRGRQDRDDEHINSHQERSAEEGTATPDALNKEEEEEQAGDDLDNAKEARKQEIIVTGTNELENLRSVWKLLIADSHRATEFLPSYATYSKLVTCCQ